MKIMFALLSLVQIHAPTVLVHFFNTVYFCDSEVKTNPEKMNFEATVVAVATTFLNIAMCFLYLWGAQSECDNATHTQLHIHTHTPQTHTHTHTHTYTHTQTYTHTHTHTHTPHEQRRGKLAKRQPTHHYT